MVLRHDVDKRPDFSLAFARLQQELGVQGTYYFRIVKESFAPKIVEQIAGLGHEIGYHYEDLALIERAIKGEKGKGRRENGGADGSRESGVRKNNVEDDYKAELLERGIASFEKNLVTLRQCADIKTICMHGSPMSRWDSRLLWERYDYRDFGLVGEPYFDVDFDRTAYYTDTGRRWDGEKVSVRDKPMEKQLSAKNKKRRQSDHVKLNHSFPVFHSTFDMIRALEHGDFPNRAMLTFHPQRWTDHPVLWVRELVEQNVKNGVKMVIVRGRERGVKRRK